MEKNRLVINLGNGRNLIAEIVNVGSVPQIVVGIEEENGTYVQDICLVEQHIDRGETQEDFSFKKTEDINCFVWADESDENYTKQYVIKQYHEPDEE